MHYLECSLKLRAAADKPAPVVEILGNAGGRMMLGGEPWVIDLKGTITNRGKPGVVPILYAHDWDVQLGHSEKIETTANGIKLEGLADVPSERAFQWTESARTGFPWQASLGFVVTNFDEIKDGESVEINGRKEEGPLKVAREIEVWEVSVVTFGADGGTSTRVVKGERMKEEIKDKTATAAGGQCEKNAATSDPQLEEVRARYARDVERIEELKAIAAKYDRFEGLAEAIKDGTEPQAFELATLRATRSSCPGSSCSAGVDRANVAAAAILRANGSKIDERHFTAAELEAADSLKSGDFRAIVEGAFDWRPTTSERGDARTWCEAALSTHGLATVLSKSANALLLNALGSYERRWEPFFKVSAVNDFRKSTRFRIDSSFTFEEVAEGEEFNHGEQDALVWEIQAKTYGKQYILGYQSIVNGEAVGAFSDIMRQIAYGAESALNRICWGLVTNPGSAVDGVDYYNAAHGSLLASKPLNVDNLAAAYAAFQTRKKKGGEPAGVEPKFLVVPPSLAATARQIVNSTYLNNGASENVGAFNPLANICEVISAPQLEFSEYAGASASTWYLFSDPAKCAAFEVSYLHGMSRPEVRSNSFDIGRLGLAVDGFISFGAIAEDWRGALKVTA